MKIIWTFTLLMIPGVVSSISVTGYSGGGVIITCRYNRKYTDNAKYFCRGQFPGCFDLIKTEVKEKWVHKGRFSLYDDTSAAVFNVTIRDLSEQDSGTYRCAVDISRVQIPTLKSDCCEKSISLSAAAGESVNISCKYPQSHSANVKFVWRRSGYDLCAEETSVKENRRWSAEGQIQLYDDREQQLLTGTISHVTQQHSAEYWCGVQSDQGHKSFITRVLISVTVLVLLYSKNTFTTTTTTTTIIIIIIIIIIISSSFSSSVRTPLITEVSKSSPSGFTAAGSSLIIPLVLVLVLLALIITGLLLLFLFKKHQSRGSGSSSQAGAGKHDLVSHTGCDYEEIKDTQKQLPTNPSDSSNTVYATAQLPTNPSDSSNTVYATAQLPTNPSVSPNCVYSTVHEATGDS
ncbi:CMRF35-like molecule 8 [Labeo rohita]|uniref:CMRF35-like molecule 8 n=1 Tax=Labeo rohita TaxID=84645 RepID=UPI0021E280A0|nr:CMRF35-like molecule 8 [Labeo rohita]